MPDPKPPGRAPGAGPFRDREAPPPAVITAPCVDVRVLIEACPAWGGPLAEARLDWASTTERPVVPRPQVTPDRVGVCRGTVCGDHVRGPHPAVAPDHCGATAHRLGARVMAAAHGLPQGIGIPGRTVPRVMAALTGGRLTPGALTPAARRRAAGAVGRAYEPWRTAGPAAPVVHTADTGWRVGGEPADRMAFETDGAPVQHLRARPRHDDVPEVLPADYPGVRVTHRGRRANAHAFDGVPPQQCLAHIPRSISDGRATKPGTRARRRGAAHSAVARVP